MKLLKIAGWAGFVLSLIIYYMLSEGYLAGTDNLYQFLQLISFALLGLNAWESKDWAIVWLEIAFSLIALKTLLS